MYRSSTKQTWRPVRQLRNLRRKTDIPNTNRRQRRLKERLEMHRNQTRKWQRVIVAAVLAAGSLQAAGTIKPYTNRAAFAAEDAVDWGGLTTLAGGDKGVTINSSFSNLVSGLGSVVISGKAPGSNLKRYNEGISFFGNFTGGDRLLATLIGNPGPLTITFTSGPVYGAGLQIQSLTLGPFTGQLRAFDSAGNVLGSIVVNGVATNVLPADNSAPFMGIRSSLKEIAKIEIDTPNNFGFAVNKLDVPLTSSPILNSTFYVNQLYQDVLNRLPTSTELTDGVSILKANPTGGLASLAYSVFTSAEFHDNAKFLTKCYFALLQRDPDIATWVPIFKIMQSGTQQLTTLTGFLGTPEYLAAYPDSLSSTQFVTNLYLNLLGRSPDAGGLSYWTFILSLGIPRSYVLNGFISSPEYDARVLHRVDANLNYMAFLKRNGEASGLNFWTVVMNSGIPLSSVVSSFVTSPEYFARF